ncbi:MAG TPA: methyltransferase domain-containing protein [Burkholderiales bacterium]|nr:methyltransferase domain-containing protein [Burkholderiales bacterium]
MSTNVPPRSLSEWFTATPLGQYLLAREQAYYDAAVADVFGFHALQLGLPRHDFLRANRIAHRFCVACNSGAELRADYRDLPLATGSVDLLLLPHALEFHADPHQILREVQRVLVPEGQVIVSAFNPWSLWGLRHAFSRTPQVYPWCGRFIDLPRLKDWLALLGLEIVAGRMCCYVPPCSQDKWLARFRFMEAAGDRWWPVGGGAYFLHAIKRVRGVRIIMPQRIERLVPKKQLAPVPEKVAARDGAIAARETLDA